MKIGTTAGCVLLIALAAGAAAFGAARLYMTPENVLRSVQDALELQLGARLSCGAVDVQPLSGIMLRDVALFDTGTDGAEPLLRCAEVRLTHSLLPLLLQRLLIRDIEVIDPVLMFPDRPVRRRRPAATSGAPPPLQVIVLPRSVRVCGGRVQASDACGLGLEDITCDVRGMSLLHDAPVSLSARMTGDHRAEFAGTGRFSLSRRSLRLGITCREASLERFKEHLNCAGIPLVAGLVSMQADVTTGNDTAELQLTCALRDGSLRLPASSEDAPGTSLEMTSLQASATLRAVWDMPSGTWEIQDISGSLLSAPFSGSGALRAGPAGTRLSCVLELPAVRAEELFEHCRTLPEGFPEGLRLHGPLGARLSIQGGAGSTGMSQALLLRFQDTRVLYPAFGRFQPRLSGTVALDAERVSSDALKIGTDDLWICLAGDVSRYRTQSPLADLRIVSSYLNLPGLFTPDQNADTAPIGPLDFGPLRFEGPIDLGTSYLLGMKLGTVQGRYRFERNVFEIRDLCGMVGEGRFSTGLGIDLGVQGLAYSARIDVDGIAMSEALQLVPGDAKQHLGGAISGSFSFTGTGSDYGACMRNLTARADLDIADAVMNLPGLFPQLAGLSVEPSLEHVGFDSAGLRLNLSSGAVAVSGAFECPQISLYPEGTIGLDGTLDLDVHLHLAPELLEHGRHLPDCLIRDRGVPVVPITVRGSFAEPRVELCGSPD